MDDDGASAVASSGDDGAIQTISTFFYPVLRLVVAGIAVWYSSGASA